MVLSAKINYDNFGYSGRSMNEFLNENWREMVNELGPPVAEALNQVLTQLMTSIARTVPYDDIFPDVPARS
jgi:Haemolymph juvenile hormone binding protein (JHBP)